MVREGRLDLPSIPISSRGLAGLQSARQNLAEDLWSEDGLINGETRKILGGDDPRRAEDTAAI